MIVEREYRIFLMAGVAIAALYYIYMYKFGMLFIPTDPYYYISMADSFMQSGKLQDVTQEPARPFKTLQNAVPIIHVFLKGVVGLTSLTAMKTLTIINGIAWLSAFYPFWNLKKFMGIKHYWASGLLIIGFFTSSCLLTWQFIPGTDGIFHAGALWMLFLWLRLLHGVDSGKDVGAMHNRLILFFLCFLSGILVHFSIRIIFYQVAILVALLLCRWGRKAYSVIAAVLMFLCSCVSLLVPYVLLNSFPLALGGKDFHFTLLDRSLSVSRMLLNYLGLGNVFVGPNGYYLLSLLICLMVGACWAGYKKNSVLLVVIPVSVMVFALFNLSLPNPVIAQSGARYMVSTLPLLCLLGMKFMVTRHVTCVLISAFTMFTIGNMISGFPYSCYTAFWWGLMEESFVLPEQTVLLSERSRYTYVSLNGRNYSRPLSTLNASCRHIWIAGSGEFMNERMRLISKTKGLAANNATVLFAKKGPGCMAALVSLDIIHPQVPEKGR